MPSLLLYALGKRLYAWHIHACIESQEIYCSYAGTCSKLTNLYITVTVVFESKNLARRLHLRGVLRRRHIPHIQPFWYRLQYPAKDDLPPTEGNLYNLWDELLNWGRTSHKTPSRCGNQNKRFSV